MPDALSVHFTDYDPDWAYQAQERIARLRVLEPVLVAAHHIGSTAVPEMMARPTVDLMLLVTDLEALDRERGAVEALGYRWHGEHGIPGRRHCTRDVGQRRMAELQFFVMGSRDAHRHLAFRDYLRAHPGAASAYAAAKRRVRDQHPHDDRAYTAARRSWIDQTEAQALAWYAARSA
jgi:GrpB-like predicted nucleotidyltransferase (UPF0157 family)